MPFFRSAFSVGLVLALPLGLLACSGESNNLADPVAGSRAVCSEVYSNDECIPGRFIADAAVNLDYECGRVKAVTGVDGSFTCPKNSQVTFSIRNPDTTIENAKSITLGQAVVRKPALLCTATSTTNCSGASTGRLYVTPSTLTADAVAQKNMVRLLLALNRDPFAVSIDSPAHRLVLDDNDKGKLESLTASLTLSDFSKPADESPSPDPDSFDALLAPFLAALTPAVAALPSVADASKVLDRAQFATKAGVYSANSLAGFSDILGGSDCTNCGVPGLAAETPSIHFSADMWVVVDRKGRMIGYGFYAKKNKTDTGAFLYSSAFTFPMVLQNPESYVLTQYSDVTIQNSVIPDVPLWPANGRLKGLSYKMLSLDANSQPINPVSGSRTLTFFSGIMDRGAIAGTNSTFTNLFGDNPDSSVELGQWLVEDSSPSTSQGYVGSICPAGGIATAFVSACTSSGQAGHTSSYTLMHSTATAPTLDPQLWENDVLNNSLLPKIQFPINMEITFKNSNTTPDVLGSIYVSILRDGNIVTNLNYDPLLASPNCNTDIDPVTLKNADGTQQYPIGVVQNISKTTADDSIPNEVFITPLLMVTDKAVSALASADARKKLAFVQLQSNLNQSLVIRIGSKDDVKPKLDAWTVSMNAQGSNGCNAAAGCAVFGTAAGWMQSWHFWRSANNDSNHQGVDASGIIETKRAEKCYP